MLAPYTDCSFLLSPSFLSFPLSFFLFFFLPFFRLFLLRTSDGTGSAKKIVRRDGKEWEGKRLVHPQNLVGKV